MDVEVAALQDGCDWWFTCCDSLEIQEESEEEDDDVQTVITQMAALTTQCQLNWDDVSGCSPIASGVFIGDRAGLLCSGFFLGERRGLPSF